MGAMVKVFLSTLLFSGVACQFQWTNDSVEGEMLYRCVDESVTFPWHYHYTRTQARVHGLNKLWFFHPTATDRELVATAIYGFFNPSPIYTGRSEEVSKTSAALVVNNLTLDDTGNYTALVRTTTFHHFHTVGVRRTQLLVLESLAAKDGQLRLVQLKDPVKDFRNGFWAIALGCGEFTYPGRPPFDVVWKLPGGEVVETSDFFFDGYYILLIHNPVMGGIYECQVPEDERDCACIDPEDVGVSMASIELEEIPLQVELLVAESVELKQNLTDFKETASLLYEDLAKPHVSFNMGLMDSSKPSHNNDSVILFDREIMNVGRAFNTETGCFIAPHTGEYYFALTVKSVDGFTSARIVKRRVTDMRKKTLCRANSDPLTSALCQAAASLATGDIVCARGLHSNRLSYRLSSFAGFLINDASTLPDEDCE